MVTLLVTCSPILRPATFEGARSQVTESNLVGPFDGQVVDAGTQTPISDVSIVGVWSYDQGQGFIAPRGSETIEVQSDKAGRYRLPQAPQKIRGLGVRLVAFQLFAYKRGYVAYRSDRHLDGSDRTDFTVRHNTIALRKWQQGNSHAEHLLFLNSPREISQLSHWEQTLANLDLYRQLRGRSKGIGQTPTGVPGSGTPDNLSDSPVKPAQGDDLPKWLDARGMISPEELLTRTGGDPSFTIQDLRDLERTEYYHGVHYQAQDREVTHDFAYRVWRKPPGTINSVVETFQSNFPDVKISTEVTEQTWILSTSEVHAVAFIDKAAETAVLLTCGTELCQDLATAIVLAKHLHDRIDRLDTISAPVSSEPTSTEADPSEGPSSESATSGPGQSESTGKLDSPRKSGSKNTAPQNLETQPSEAGKGEAPSPTVPGNASLGTPPDKTSSQAKEESKKNNDKLKPRPPSESPKPVPTPKQSEEPKEKSGNEADKKPSEKPNEEHPREN